MPNTLAHLGVQSILTRGVIAGADLKWAYLGLVVPDLPWIGFRIFNLLPTKPYYYDGMAYAHVQSSLLFCLLLCSIFACSAERPRRAFAILALNAFFHLVLDSLQTKWANGVHFFAPFSWKLENFGLFWPESLTTILLTLLGLATVIATWRSSGNPVIDLVLPRGRRLLCAVVLIFVYFLAPLSLKSGPLAADNHSIRTLLAVDDRAGRLAAFDRAPVIHRDGKVILMAADGEEFLVAGPTTLEPGVVSLRGRFLDRRTLKADDVHRHWGVVRDYPTLLGLLLIAVIWVKALWLQRTRSGKKLTI
jgi:hypothetical protein